MNLVSHSRDSGNVGKIGVSARFGALLGLRQHPFRAAVFADVPQQIPIVTLEDR
jgi:hypothetical protein